VEVIEVVESTVVAAAAVVVIAAVEAGELMLIMEGKDHHNELE